MRTSGTYKSLVKPIFSANSRTLLLTGFIITLVNIVLNLIKTKLDFVGGLLGLLLTILITIVVEILAFGAYKVANEAVTTGHTDTSMITYGFEHIGEIAIFTVIYTVCTALLLLLLIVPGIIYIYTYAMVPFVFAENPNITYREAMSISKELMRGHRFELFMLQLSFILWLIGSAITFGILNVYVIPYQLMTMAYFYQDLKNLH